MRSSRVICEVATADLVVHVLDILLLRTMGIEQRRQYASFAGKRASSMRKLHVVDYDDVAALPP